MAPLLDLDNPDSWQDLSAAYAPARAAGPVYFGDNGSVIVLRHAQASALLKDPAFGVTDLLALYGITRGPAWEWWRQVMASLNPPDHTRVRSTVSRAFTPRAVDKLRPRIRALAAELLEDAIAVAGDGEIDVISDYANQLPSRVMSHMLAIPDRDQVRFAGWTSDIGLIFGAAVARDTVRLHHVERALGQLYEYIGRLSADRRAHPGDDLLSMLIEAEARDERLSKDELAALVANLLFAGHDTTRSQLMIAFYLLAAYPEQFHRLKADPSLVVNATEEMVRFEPSVVGTARQPLEDTVICDVPVAAGTPVQIALIAAGRDPLAYEDPDRFDIGRTDTQPINFGGGIHHCLGAALARAELQESLLLLAKRVHQVSLTKTPAWVPYASIRRFDELTVRLGLP